MEGEKSMRNCLFAMLLLLVVCTPVFAAGDTHQSHENATFWTTNVVWLSVAMIGALLLMVALPLASKIIDEEISYLFLALGGGMLALSLHLGVIGFDAGCFVQHLLHGHREGLHTLLGESWVLITCYFVLSFLAIVYRKRIESVIGWWAERMTAHWMVFWWVLTMGMLGSISVVVMAVVGGIFFKTLQRVKERDYTASVVVYSAMIGISALLTTVGEPLSLFIARNLGESTPYLLRTFSGIVVLNAGLLAVLGLLTAKHWSPALEPVADEEDNHGSFKHKVDHLFHTTAKLYFFVLGLLLFGEAVKPIAAHVFGQMPPMAAFFGNAMSAIADNALLGLLEVLEGMSQSTVMVLGISLAFWGVAMVPGNVCNIVLKETLNIPFGKWAKYGIPLACILCIFNLVLILLGAGTWLTF